MKLQRDAINLGSEYRGNWAFSIHDKDGDRIARVEAVIDAMEIGIRGDGRVLTWRDHSDMCPLYDEGIGCGYMIPVDMVDEFKAAWAIAKKTK
ncbi:hypothetical protein [Aeromonas phage AS-yj]|uniref:Phage protein n=2 Tax=Ceceduovirus aszj TaxID=2843652 RepID=A0A291LD12_9CAUD|nr:hypothetical protein [Aeromonas phage AS-szw]ATI17820.1 hypothetical protein [Aeromonas phage AS-yj]